MLFRILQYDCQKLLNENVSFLSVYVPVRDTELLTTEFDVFQDDALKFMLSESHLVLLLTKQLASVLTKHLELVPQDRRQALQQLAQDRVSMAFQFSSVETYIFKRSTYEVFLEEFSSVLERELLRLFNSFIAQRFYDKASYQGPVFTFDTLLGPIADWIPSNTGKTIYFLVDDADDLPESHTITLNTWIARRRSSVAFKVSTMYLYKTYETKGRSAIQHPHDFFLYEVATRHLKDELENYVELLRQICESRLKLKGIDASAKSFFPPDLVQEAKVKTLEAKLIAEYSTIHSGRAIKDNVYRHLTSEYKKSLLARRTSGTYIYAGFETLAELSSGLVRDFIICAQRMYDSQRRRIKPASAERVTAIDASIQSDVVKKYASELLLDISNASQRRDRSATPEEWGQVHRFIEALGSVFKDKMYSSDSERRVFSFAFQDEPDPDVSRVIDLAIAEGYLMKGFISRKEGTGRRNLYMLTRRLAPAFDLDVSAYSGYLSLTSARARSFMDRGPERSESQGAPQLQLSFLDSGDWPMIAIDEAGY